MVPLRRHQLAYPTRAGWDRLLDAEWDGEARACLAHWAARALPLVVTRRPPGLGDDRLALGLPAPRQWSRRRLALALPLAELLYLGEFPPAARLDTVAPPQRPAWDALCRGLALIGVGARVYGSHGWQMLTRLGYLRNGSDVDLALAADDADAADAAVRLLAACERRDPALRLDGEIVFGCGSAVAWREWAAWRGGRTPSILVKRLDGASVERAPFLAAAGAAALPAAALLPT